ncbi:ABC transporter ATP-binding protein [Tsukamurella ocularis]|uniref:ABC transporter ATP-binding protein n=1 Tax=Tsukamurella ocularis TaxID=1970234 RepID=UPI00216772EA|nr:ABC transporter ATP-binding protein [Tsukamurella ocularis]MCS3778588.1 ABC-2 type transport system ATP-binding protein [Tsukamurella ocularis]MCS3789289.1 ABC-2 type transport system ATP-binding protein [Tsukamurella ocularis]MCS3853139.1 ABC-2 type transport system ATP-binding protein [Tsukamurella ocularis]
MSAPTSAAGPVIEATGLRRTYGTGTDAFEAVRGIDLRVEAGEVFALLGTNGAGKTSTLDLLEGLARPSAGELAVFGLDPHTERRRVRPLTGIMLQSGGLPAELTVRETLEMWRGTCSNPTTADAVLDRVTLRERADVRVGALSGGEQRRVDLACALIGQPRLLFLDEPTTGLDPESRRSTWKLLAELKRDGVTMVLTTHYLDEAEALADRIAIMHRGAIARLGTLREIVGGHPAEIAFDDPGVPLPSLAGGWSAEADGAGRVTLRTFRLQDDLHALLGWAADRGLALSGLQARHPSLESVFLTIASGDETVADETIGVPA